MLKLLLPAANIGYTSGIDIVETNSIPEFWDGVEKNYSGGLRYMPRFQTELC